MEINGAWYLDSMPTMVIIEKEDGTMAMFSLNPFREIQESDLRSYKGYHPRKCKGQPLPTYLYKFYGLGKNEESLSETIHTRVTPSEKEKLETYGQNQEPPLTPSEVVRKQIKSIGGII